MHNLNRNLFVAQRTVTKKRFLRHNRCIELGKRYIKALASARVKQLSPVYTCSSFEPIVRKRHLELIWITRKLTSLDICALTMFRNFNHSNYNTE